MKKNLLVLGLIATTGFSYSQKNNRTSAIMSLKNGYILKAKNYIDKAIVHEKTKEDAKTWFYYSQIYGQVMMSKDEKLNEFKASAVENVFKGLKNTTKFDTKGNYKNDIAKIVGPMYSMNLQQGISLYTDKKYDKALEVFEASQEIAEILKITDSVGIYNSALAAKGAKNTEKAIKYYEKSAELGYAGSDPYFNLISLYGEAKSKEGAEAIIKKAREKYPTDPNILLEQTRFYIEAGQSEKAEKDLLDVVAKDPKNVTLRHALGVVYEQLGKNDLAIESYKAGLAIEDNHKNCIKNLGLTYNSIAADLNEQMNNTDIDEQEKYDKLKAGRDANLNLALPYLEKSYTTFADPNLKRVLNQGYRILKLNDKIIK